VAIRLGSSLILPPLCGLLVWGMMEALALLRWGDQRTASTPLCAASDNSLREGPLGRFSPRSHWLMRLLPTLKA